MWLDVLFIIRFNNFDLWLLLELHALTLATCSYVLLRQLNESDELRCWLKCSLNNFTPALSINTLTVHYIFVYFSFHAHCLDRFGFARHQSAASYKGHPSTVLWDTGSCWHGDNCFDPAAGGVSVPHNCHTALPPLSTRGQLHWAHVPVTERTLQWVCGLVSGPQVSRPGCRRIADHLQ